MNRRTHHALFVALLAPLAFRAVRGWRRALTERGNDLTIYLDGASALARGRDPLTVEDSIYLPSFSAFLAPFDALPRALVAGAWQTASFACVVLGILGAARLADPRRECPWLPWATLLMTWRLFDANVSYGQANAFTFAALVAALLLITRGRDTAAGALVGLATAFKILPGIAFLLLAVRGAWRAIALGAAVVLALAASVALWLGPRGAVLAHADWFRAVPMPYLEGGDALLEARPYVAGQSLVASAYRLLADTPVTAADAEARRSIARMDPARVHAIVRALTAVFLALLAFALVRGRAWRDPDGVALLGALTVTTALVVAPLVHKAHVSWSALAVAVLLVGARDARGSARHRRAVPLVLFALLVSASTPALLGTALARDALGVSALFLGVQALWWGLFAATLARAPLPAANTGRIPASPV